MITSCTRISLFSHRQQTWKPYCLNQFELEGVFQVLQNNRGKPQQAKILLLNSKLGMNVESQLDISNFFIAKIHSRLLGEGIQLKSNSFSLELFGEVDNYYEKLTRYCIQTNFTQKYTVQSLIGAGTYGKVYRVRSKNDHKIYAVKTFEKQLLSRAADVEALIKEISILRELHHIGINKLYEVYESEQFVFLVFQYLKNKNLNENIEDGVQMKENQAFTIVQHILQTLEYLHNQGILHRDLKPDNLVLSNDCSGYVLVDFGLADYYREDGKYLFTDCGTPGYCAPEVLAHHIYDYKVDIFSLGVILFQLLSGACPFYSSNYEERVRLNQAGRLNYDQLQISYDALDLLQGMLQRSPNKRLSAKQALNHKYFQQQQIQFSCNSLAHISDTLINVGNQISSPRFEHQFDFFELNSNSSRYTSPIHSPLRNPHIEELDREIQNNQQTYSYHTANLQKPSQLNSKTRMPPKISMILQRHQLV